MYKRSHQWSVQAILQLLLYRMQTTAWPLLYNLKIWTHLTLLRYTQSTFDSPGHCKSMNWIVWFQGDIVSKQAAENVTCAHMRRWLMVGELFNPFMIFSRPLLKTSWTTSCQPLRNLLLQGAQENTRLFPRSRHRISYRSSEKVNGRMEIQDNVLCVASARHWKRTHPTCEPLTFGMDPVGTSSTLHHAAVKLMFLVALQTHSAEVPWKHTQNKLQQCKIRHNDF